MSITPLMLCWITGTQRCQLRCTVNVGMESSRSSRFLGMTLAFRFEGCAVLPAAVGGMAESSSSKTGSARTIHGGRDSPGLDQGKDP